MLLNRYLLPKPVVFQSEIHSIGVYFFLGIFLFIALSKKAGIIAQLSPSLQVNFSYNHDIISQIGLFIYRLIFSLWGVLLGYFLYTFFYECTSCSLLREVSLGLLLVLVFQLFKWMFSHLMFFLFDSAIVWKHFRKLSSVSMAIIALALTPMMFVLFFSKGLTHTFFIFLTLSVLFVGLLMSFFFLIRIAKLTYDIHYLHIFLYLCAFELAPILILYKVGSCFFAQHLFKANIPY